MYLGGNGFYWRIAFHPEKPGVIEVRRAENGTRTWVAEPGEYYMSFTGELGGLWRNCGWPPQRLVGIGFASEGFDASSYYRRAPDSHDPRAAFIFAGIGADEPIGDFGSIGGGAAGLELDIADRRLGTPPHALILAASKRHSNVYVPTAEEVPATYPGMDGLQDPKVRADMVFFETPNGGAVFSTGSIAWAGSLAHNGYANNVARITGNVLRRFLDPAPL
jgi:N,N-dimethylformamidase beta subunit-like protein